MASCRSHLALYFAMRVSNKDRFPVGIDGGNAAITPATFAEIVSDDFPILHAPSLLRLFQVLPRLALLALRCTTR
jgi:hypothetical protein